MAVFPVLGLVAIIPVSSMGEPQIEQDVVIYCPGFVSFKLPYEAIFEISPLNRIKMIFAKISLINVMQ